MLKLYKAYIYPNLDYCSHVWNPTLKKHIQSIEKVQQLFTMLLFHRVNPGLSNEDMLDYIERLNVLSLLPVDT